MFLNLLLTVVLSRALSVDADCKLYPQLIYCQKDLPNLRLLLEAGSNVNLIIQNFNGSLAFNGQYDQEERGIHSIQILRSTITYIQPSFFSRLSQKKLKKLSISTVEGTINLDYATLSGLEQSLEELRASDVQIGTTDYLYTMGALKSLYLVRTKLSALPDNFPVLIDHLRNVDLSNNGLHTMPWDVLMKSLSREDFENLRLGNNPWICDCKMKPVVEAPVHVRRKIVNLVCASPEELAALSVTNLTPQALCPNDAALDPTGDNTQPGSNRNDGSNNQQSQHGPAGGKIDQSSSHPNDVEVATAGSVSNEVIAIIIAVILVVVIVLIAVIVFKVRSRKREQNQGGSSKKPSHKSSAYCHVIEHPNMKQAPSAKNSTGGLPPSGTQASSYGRDAENNERQPLAPSYYSQQDNRL